MHTVFWLGNQKGRDHWDDVCVDIIIIGIQPLGRFGQTPELSQVTSTALVQCILGKFLGVDCHYFPPFVI